MQDLNRFFPGCQLSSDQIKQSIKTIIGIEDDDSFCFTCFRYLIQKKYFCPVCYILYCDHCLEKVRKFDSKNQPLNEVEPKRCYNCEENTLFYKQHGYKIV